MLIEHPETMTFYQKDGKWFAEFLDQMPLSDGIQEDSHTNNLCVVELGTLGKDEFDIEWEKIFNRLQKIIRNEILPK